MTLPERDSSLVLRYVVMTLNFTCTAYLKPGEMAR